MRSIMVRVSALSAFALITVVYEKINKQIFITCTHLNCGKKKKHNIIFTIKRHDCPGKLLLLYNITLDQN